MARPAELREVPTILLSLCAASACPHQPCLQINSPWPQVVDVLSLVTRYITLNLLAQKLWILNKVPR